MDKLSIVGRIETHPWECDHMSLLDNGGITTIGKRSWVFDGCGACADIELDKMLAKETAEQEAEA